MAGLFLVVLFLVFEFVVGRTGCANDVACLQFFSIMLTNKDIIVLRMKGFFCPCVLCYFVYEKLVVSPPPSAVNMRHHGNV